MNTSYTTLLFDIGNVLIDIDYEVMEGEFRKIAVRDFRELIQYHTQVNIFDQLERGELTAGEFRQILRQYLKPDVTDAEIDAAWNSILIAYPKAKLEWLGYLRRKGYRVLALSNINEIHVAEIDRYVSTQLGAVDMRSYFDHAYYSHEIGRRKPERACYELVLERERRDASDILFIDDKAENTAAAAALGIQTLHLTDRDSLMSLLRDL